MGEEQHLQIWNDTTVMGLIQLLEKKDSKIDYNNFGLTDDKHVLPITDLVQEKRYYIVAKDTESETSTQSEIQSEDSSQHITTSPTTTTTYKSKQPTRKSFQLNRQSILLNRSNTISINNQHNDTLASFASTVSPLSPQLVWMYGICSKVWLPSDEFLPMSRCYLPPLESNNKPNLFPFVKFSQGGPQTTRSNQSET
eukprot:TRINITY_DN2616_c0_g1_i1.p1 TRINITY_DN2616_c0_g1~~TRINITY_DN2616_c0_g1_i1.p1  ORF type:complete len:215 (-),score=51.79 TRINITY_DN2616_c0_g1_i1:146-736(-)